MNTPNAEASPSSNSPPAAKFPFLISNVFWRQLSIETGALYELLDPKATTWNFPQPASDPNAVLCRGDGLYQLCDFWIGYGFPSWARCNFYDRKTSGIWGCFLHEVCAWAVVVSTGVARCDSHTWLESASHDCSCFISLQLIAGLSYQFGKVFLLIFHTFCPGYQEDVIILELV